MAATRNLKIYLEPDLHRSAVAGRHNFIALMVEVAETAGYTVELRINALEERLAALGRRELTLCHMAPPINSTGLTFRRVYYYPFWAIERTEKRWDWRVAQRRFDPSRVPRKAADAFFDRWQSRLFADAARGARSDGYIYVPLQGRLLDHRSFQACSPLKMIEHILDADRHRPVVATLHPKEAYSDREIQALESLSRRFPRLTIETGQMERWLSGCDYVVTENSSAAFAGYFFRKPAVLFAAIDFGHIARNVSQLGPADAITSVHDEVPDYAGYVHWFWQRMSINAGRPDARDRIAKAFFRAGWPMERS